MATEPLSDQNWRGYIAEYVDEPVAAPKSWWQFSLRSLFVLITLFAVALGWFFSGPERQRRAAQQIRDSGGGVWFTSDPPQTASSNYPKEGWLPLEYTMSVKGFATDGNRWTDAEMAPLADLPALEYCMILAGPGVGWDRGGIPFSPSPISEKGLANLSGLTRLKSLQMRGVAITDEGMACLASLTDLEHLVIDQAPVTDKGLAHLSNKAQLNWLELYGSNCSDAGLAHLSRCTKLTLLRLSGKGITDAGLVHLREMKQLEHLELRETSITDAGKRHLYHPNLQKLKFVHIQGSGPDILLQLRGN